MTLYDHTLGIYWKLILYSRVCIGDALSSAPTLPGPPECEMKQAIHFPVWPTVGALSFFITVKQKAEENNYHLYALVPPPTKTNEDGFAVSST